MDYTTILTRAWRISWDHKVLWLFGLLAWLGQGGGGATGGSGWRESARSMRGPDQGPGAEAMQRFFERIPPAAWVGIILLILLLVVAIIVLAVLGKAGLIGGIRLADAQGQVSFAEAWAQGRAHFGRIFLIGLLLGLAMAVLVLLTVLPGIALTALTFGVGVICLIPLICLLALVGVAVSVYGNLAQVAAVLDGLSAVEALRRAWSVIVANVGNVVVLTIILALVGGIASFLVSLPIVLIVFPAAAGVIFGTLADAPRAVSAVFVLAAMCFVAYLPVLLVAQGIITTWTTSAWTLAYRQFTGRAAVEAVPA